MLIQLVTGEITPPAIAQALKNEIIILTIEDIELPAKKLEYPAP